MYQLRVNLNTCIDAFERCEADRFTVIKTLDLGDIREDIDTLKVEVHLLT